MAKKNLNEAGFEVPEGEAGEKLFEFIANFNGRTTSTKEDSEGEMQTTHKLNLKGAGQAHKVTIEFEDLDWFKDTFGLEFEDTGQIELRVTLSKVNKSLDEF